MASFVFLKAKAAFAKGQIAWLTDVIRIMPVNAVPNADTAEFVSDVSATEIGAARATLGSKAVNEDTSGDEAECDAADATHSAVATGSTAVGSVVYQQTGGDDSTPANDRVIAFLDYTDTPTNGGDLVVQFAAEGILKL